LHKTGSGPISPIYMINNLSNISNFANVKPSLSLLVVTFIEVSAMSTKVAMDSLKFHLGPQCPTLLRLAGGPPPKRPYGHFWVGPLTKFYSMPIEMAKMEAVFQLVNRFVILKVKRGPYHLIFY
jgi:hypothetical protein